MINELMNIEMFNEQWLMIDDSMFDDWWLMINV